MLDPRAIPRSRAPANRPGVGRVHDARNQIIQFFASGMSNKHIARPLVLSEGTVTIHVHNVYRELGVTSRAALSACVLGRRSSET